MPLPWEEYIRRVQAFEGDPSRPSFYQAKPDVRQWTSGYGTKARPGERIDLPEAERRFSDEFGRSRAAVQSAFPGLPPGPEAALASLHMNAGGKFINAGLGDAVRRQDWDDAQRRLLQYTSPDPRYKPGLFNRRQQEAQWLRDQGTAAPPAAPLGAAGLTRAGGQPLPADWGPPIMGLGAGTMPAPVTALPATKRGPEPPQITAPPPTPMPTPTPGPAYGPALPDLGNVLDMGEGASAPTADFVPPPPDTGAAPQDFQTLYPGAQANELNTAPQQGPPIASGMGDPRSQATVQFPPIGDLGGFGIPPTPSASALGSGPLGPLLPGAPQGFPTDTNVPQSPGIAGPTVGPDVPPPPAKLGPNELPPGWGPQGAPAGVERRGPGPGMGPQGPAYGGFGRYLTSDKPPPGFGGFFGQLRDAFQNPMTGAGLNLLFPNTQAGQILARGGEDRYKMAELGLRQRADTREQLTWEQKMAQIAQREKVFGDVFPGGETNTKHPLLDKVPAGMAEVVKALGPEVGIPLLGQYQLKDAEGRGLMQRRLEMLTQMDEGTPTAAPAAPGVSPVAPAPQMGPFSGLGIGGPGTPPAIAPAPAAPGAPAPPAGPRAFPAIPMTTAFNALDGEIPAPAPRRAPAQVTTTAAPAPQAQAGRFAGGVPEPMVETQFGPRTLSQAERLSTRLNTVGEPDQALMANIAAARAPYNAALTKQLEMDVAQREAKPAMRTRFSGLIDAVDRQKALATKLFDDPELKNATGAKASARFDPQASKFWGTDIPIDYFSQSQKGSHKRTIENDMQALVQKVGLATLQALKSETAQGSSGLGSTSEREITMLENALAALKDPTIETGEYRANLNIVRQVSDNVKARALQQWQDTYGEEFKHPPGHRSDYPTEPAGKDGEAPRTRGRYGLTGLIMGDVEDQSMKGRARAKANEKMRQGAWKVEEVD